MKKFTVIYCDPSDETFSRRADWLFFVCDADDADHAEEQCENAYPDCRIVGIVVADNPLDAVQILDEEFFG
jgi:hypothetical protein